MRTRYQRWLTVSVLAAAGCGTPGPTGSGPDPLPTPGESVVLEAGEVEFELKVGEAARVAGRDLIIGLNGVGEDSRCPVDVTCVWQGDAAVLLALGQAAGRERVTLHTALDPRSVRRAGVAIKVVAVTPDPRSDRRIPPDAYRVRLRVREG